MNLRFFLYGMGFALVAILGAIIVFALHTKKAAENTASKIKMDSIIIIDKNGLESSLVSNKTPVIVNIWATWCNPCIAEMPLLSSVAQKTQGKFKIVMLTDESAEKVAAFQAQHPELHLDFYRLKNSTIKKLGISSYPTTLLLDIRGNTIWTLAGQIKDDEDYFIHLMESELSDTR